MSDSFSDAIGRPVGPENLRGQGDWYAGEAHTWVEETLRGGPTTLPGPEAATVMAILAVYAELRRLGKLAPSAADMIEHTAALNRLSSTLIDQRLFGS